MLELDEVVRQNQLACLPFAKSGRAESDLLERYPELTELLERGKQVKIDSMAIKSRLHEDEVKFSSSGKMKIRSGGDGTRSASDPLLVPHSSKSKSAESRSPMLKPRTSATDLMFDMDDDTEKDVKGPASDNMFPIAAVNKDRDDYDNQHPKTPSSSLPNEKMWFDSRGKAISSPAQDLNPSSFTGLDASSPLVYGREDIRMLRTAQDNPIELNSQGDKVPWRGATFSSAKLDMKDIMAQTSENTQSQLSSALSGRRVSEDLFKTGTSTKLSQKERKKQLQQQQLQNKPVPSSPELSSPGSIALQEKPTSPWRTASTGTKVSLKEVLHNNNQKRNESPSSKARTASNSALTLRQTVPGTAVAAPTPSVKQPDSHLASAQRSISSPPAVTARPTSKSSEQTGRPSPQALQNPTPTRAGPSSTSAPTPKSIRQTPTPVEPSLQLSMADILSQQQTEKDIIREAAAKRSLQEIQEEQAFQEWWNQEEAATRARLIEEEAAAKLPSGGSSRGGKPGRAGRGRGKGGAPRGRGRGGRGGREGHDSAAGPAAVK